MGVIKEDFVCPGCGAIVTLNTDTAAKLTISKCYTCNRPKGAERASDVTANVVASKKAQAPKAKGRKK